ncbi:hypothetical protein S83_048342 [Arachis hypogaea]
MFSSGAAKASLEAGHGGLHRYRNTLCLVCIANNANTRLLDFRSSCQMDLIRLARWPRFQLGFRAHPRGKRAGLHCHVSSEMFPFTFFKSMQPYLRKCKRRFILLDARSSFLDVSGSFLRHGQAGFPPYTSIPIQSEMYMKNIDPVKQFIDVTGISDNIGFLSPFIVPNISQKYVTTAHLLSSSFLSLDSSGNTCLSLTQDRATVVKDTRRRIEKNNHPFTFAQIGSHAFSDLPLVAGGKVTKEGSAGDLDQVYRRVQHPEPDHKDGYGAWSRFCIGEGVSKGVADVCGKANCQKSYGDGNDTGKDKRMVLEFTGAPIAVITEDGLENQVGNGATEPEQEINLKSTPKIWQLGISIDSCTAKAKWIPMAMEAMMNNFHTEHGCAGGDPVSGCAGEDPHFGCAGLMTMKCKDRGMEGVSDGERVRGMRRVHSKDGKCA